MKFKTEEMTIKDFIDFYNTGNLNLKPPYQRNPIWLKKQKQELIETIYIGYPLPNIFINKLKNNKYDMVDGQQRTQTLLGFIDNLLEDPSKK